MALACGFMSEIKSIFSISKLTRKIPRLSAYCVVLGLSCQEATVFKRELT